jgi:hypothetical protein
MSWMVIESSTVSELASMASVLKNDALVEESKNAEGTGRKLQKGETFYLKSITKWFLRTQKKMLEGRKKSIIFNC